MIPDRLYVRPSGFIDQFKIEKTLGEGGFGTVFLVSEPATGHIFALKLLRLWEIDGKSLDNILARFDMEFKTGQIDSPYLVRNYRYGSVKGNPYILMQYCPNGDFRMLLDTSSLDYHRLEQIARDILNGLESLHQNGKVHRDLKPENILFDTDQRARLADFGISGHAHIKRLTAFDFLGRPKEIFGTYMYMPPEQAKPRSNSVTILPTVDIFSFGVMMYEAFTGQLPFGKLERTTDLGTYVSNAAKGIYKDLNTYNMKVPHSWVQIIHQCINPDYLSRPQNARQISDSIGNCMPQPITSPIQESVPCIALKVMQGQEHGKIYSLNKLLQYRDLGLVKIGRMDVGVVNHIEIVDDPSLYISRQHATLEKIPRYPYWILKDGQWQTNSRIWKPSKNGTFLNTEPVDLVKGRPVRLGDIITIGDTTLKVIAE